jgi:hypothetical protein
LDSRVGVFGCREGDPVGVFKSENKEHVVPFSPQAAAECVCRHLDPERARFVMEVAMANPFGVSAAFNSMRSEAGSALLSGEELAERLYEAARKAHLAMEA